MRMVLEQFRGGVLGLGLDYRVGAHFVADIRDALLRYALGLAERSAHVDDVLRMSVRPCMPRLHAGGFLLLALRFVHPLPCVHAGRGTEEHSDIVLHGNSFWRECYRRRGRLPAPAIDRS